MLMLKTVETAPSIDPSTSKKKYDFSIHVPPQNHPDHKTRTKLPAHKKIHNKTGL